MRTALLHSASRILLAIGWIASSFVFQPLAYARPIDSMTSQELAQEILLFDFETGSQGWEIADYARGFSSLRLSDNTGGAVRTGKSALRLEVNLTRQQPSSEALVDLAAHPPAGLVLDNRSANLAERIITIWVWAPSGAR